MVKAEWHTASGPKYRWILSLKLNTQESEGTTSGQHSPIPPYRPQNLPPRPKNPFDRSADFANPYPFPVVDGYFGGFHAGFGSFDLHFDGPTVVLVCHSQFQ